MEGSKLGLSVLHSNFSRHRSELKELRPLLLLVYITKPKYKQAAWCTVGRHWGKRPPSGMSTVNELLFYLGAGRSEKYQENRAGLHCLVLALKSHLGFWHHKSQRAANYWEKRTFKLQRPTWKWNNSLRGCSYIGKNIKTLTWSIFSGSGGLVGLKKKASLGGGSTEGVVVLGRDHIKSELRSCFLLSPSIHL